MAAIAVVCGAAIIGTSMRRPRAPSAPLARASRVRDLVGDFRLTAVTSRAGVPRRAAVAAASTVGALGSLTTLALAYREPLNRCRCRSMDASTSSGADADAAPSTPERRRARRGWYRAHCARCRKRTKLGVALSFIFSPAYVACASGATAFAAHALGQTAVRGGASAYRRCRARAARQLPSP
jgi:hypothetical protein